MLRPTGSDVSASAPNPVLTLIGEKVALGPLCRDLLPTYQRWVNDFDVIRTLSIPIVPVSAEAEEAWYDSVCGAATSRLFTIYERASGRPIGNSGLHDIDFQQRAAVFGIMIGEKECWGRGFGTETTRLLLGFGFNVLNLHNIMLWAFADNERGLRAYRRAGFREFGRRRQARWRDGQPIDVVFMDCLATDFWAATER